MLTPVFILSRNDIFAQLKTNGGFLDLLKANIFRSGVIGVIIVIMIFPKLLSAQSDSIVRDFQSRFSSNLIELNELYCFSDPLFYPGKVKFASHLATIEKYEQYNFQLFPEMANYSDDFLQYLNALPLTQKQNLIRLFSFYEKQVDKSLKEADLPAELKYLAPALSMMNQNDVSVDGKAGIWQLTHFQAVMSGLQVNQLVDERFNPWLATRTFAAVMKQNIATFKTPELAVLGYLYGNAKLKNAISFAGENVTLTQIINYLPETANLVISAFQAMAVFLTENQFKAIVDPLAKTIIPDTVRVAKQLHFRQMAAVLGIPEKQLEFLNPQYRFFIVPFHEKHSGLVVPAGYWDDFVIWQDSVYNTFDSTLFDVTVQKIEYPPAPGRQYLGEPVKNLEIEGKTKIKYKLQTGDVLGIIAEKYDVEVADLKYWNNISNERKIQAGKTLDIFVDSDKVDYYAELQEKQKPKVVKPSVPAQFQQNSTLAVYHQVNTGRKLEHTVKNGESPFTIAKKYKGVTPDDILKWNNIDDARKIQIGQKLIVYEK